MFGLTVFYDFLCRVILNGNYIYSLVFVICKYFMGVRCLMFHGYSMLDLYYNMHIFRLLCRMFFQSAYLSQKEPKKSLGSFFALV